MVLIGREQECEALGAIVAAGHHVLLEGPVGVGKTRLALSVLKGMGCPVFRVDGDERFTEQKLAGWFDPAAVLQHGYDAAHFMPGPLHRAMSSGGVLFINEINRLPESVQNLLLPALDEHLMHVPALGEVHAVPGFQVIATMNPREFIATTELSEALRDRFELLLIDYQGEGEEREIVRLHLHDVPPELALGDSLDALIEQAVAWVRATRESPAFRRGASVRAAISMVRLALRMGGDLAALERAAPLALGNRVERAEDGQPIHAEMLGAWLEDQKKNN